ncbi:MAG: DUF2723 domain-containing protein [Chloroflexi bacterium]|nr:DUF2723 domain-containing protein [Chloroflexota bacterium]
MTQRTDWVFAFALFIAAFALYARTVAPGLLDGDEGEFQTNIYKLGVSHTGYPLFFLSAKLWTLVVPVGTIAYRANLFSAFLGALTIGALYPVLRWLTGNRVAAALAAILFAASRVEWSQAVIPRVYTLNSFFSVAVTALFFLWRVGKVNLTIPVFVFGLSLTNHRTMIWFAPAIGLFILWADFQLTIARTLPRGNWFSILRVWIERSALFKPRRMVELAAALGLPLLLYSYVWLRGESDVGVEFHWKDFNDMILGGNARTWLRYGSFDWLVSRVTDLYLPLLVEQFTPLGFVTGLVGMRALILNRVPRGWQSTLPARGVFFFILLANLGNSAFGLVFNTIDVEKFFIPSYLTFLFFVGVGIAVIGNWLAAHLPKGHWSGQSALAVVFVGAAGFLIAQNYARNDWSARTDVAAAWNENLSLPLEPNALIVGPWETLTPLEYSQYVENLRGDLERWKVLTQKQYLGLVPYGSRQEDIERAVRAGRAVYLTVAPNETETLTALAEEFRLTRVAELWRVIDLPPRAIVPPDKSAAAFRDKNGRAIELLGSTISPSANLRVGDFVLVTLFWRAAKSPGARLTMSLRIVDAAERVIAQRDSEPASGMRPTLGWGAQEIVQDDAGIFVPRDAAPGAYRFEIVVYDSATVQDWETASGARFRIGEVDILPDVK